MPIFKIFLYAVNVERPDFCSVDHKGTNWIRWEIEKVEKFSAEKHILANYDIDQGLSQLFHLKNHYFPSPRASLFNSASAKHLFYFV